MFGPAAHLYVYFTYGMHNCANVVTEPDGTAGAVLIRAAAVEEGLAVVTSRRGDAVSAAALLRGPGNLCRGLGITRADDGIDLLAPGSRVHIERRPGRPPVVIGTRVGLGQAADRLLRYSWLGDPAVSRPFPRDNRTASRHPIPRSRVTRTKRRGRIEPAPLMNAPYLIRQPGKNSRAYRGTATGAGFGDARSELLVLTTRSRRFRAGPGDADCPATSTGAHMVVGSGARQPGLNPPLGRAGNAARRFASLVCLPPSECH